MTQVDSPRARAWVRSAVAISAAVAVVVSGADVAHAATPAPVLSLVAADTNVTVFRYIEGKHAYLDWDGFGVNAVAGQDPFEIQVRRTSYAKPVVADWVAIHDGQKELVRLPDGLVTDFSGLKNFTTVSIDNAAGKTVKEFQTKFCPYAEDSGRTRPDAPAQSPYALYCDYDHPFTVGGLYGIQAGWNAPVSMEPPRQDERFDLPAGTYSVTAAISPAYQKVLGLDSKAATVRLKVKVVNVKSANARASLRAAQAARSANAGDAHHGAQISTYLPEFRPPAQPPVPAAAPPVDGPKPDLRSLPASGMSLEAGRNKKGKKNGTWYLNFGATVWNAGTSPLLVDGFRRTDEKLMDAYQYFFDANGEQVGSVAAGTMEWDARKGHHHWHFSDFAQYNLLRADKTLAVTSGKEAFCLADTDAIDYTLPNAKLRPENTELETACGGETALAVREVLDVGSGDTYSQSRPGQSFDVSTLPNGVYYVQVVANPLHRLAELDTENNSSLRKIILGGTKKNRKLVVPPVGLIKG